MIAANQRRAMTAAAVLFAATVAVSGLCAVAIDRPQPQSQPRRASLAAHRDRGLAGGTRVRAAAR